MKTNRLSVLLMLLLIASHLSAFAIATNVCILLLGLTALIQKSIISASKQLFKSTHFWMTTIPFFIYFISLTYTTNLSSGWKEIESKLSLILLPIIFGLLSNKKLPLNGILKWVILLVSLYPIIGFIHQIDIVGSTNDSGYFYNDNLVSLFDKQAVYYAYFINSALAFLCFFIVQNDIKKVLDKTVASLCFIALIAAQYLLASRTSLLITALIIGIFIGWIALKKLTKRQGLLLVFTTLLALMGLLAVFPKVIVRFKSVTNLEYRFDNPNPINHFNGENSDENWNGFNTRLALWSCSWELIKKSPWIGYGDGDVQDKLQEKYREKNFLLAINSNYNTHNQFFDIWLSTGIIGLLLFLCFITYFIRRSYLAKNWLFLGFITIFVISCLTENLLSRVQGLIFFSFIFSLLAFKNQKPIP